MPRHALRSELAAKLGTTWGGAAGRHVLSSEMPTPGATGRHALSSEVAAIVTGPVPPTFHGTASNRGFVAANTVGAITGTQVGDVLVAFAAGNGNNSTLTPPAGAGWTQIADSAGADAARLRVLVTTATAANQAGGTWTWAASHNHQVTIVAYTGVSVPSAATTARVASSGTINAPSQTVTTAGSLLITFAFFDTNGTAPAWPVSMTVRSAALATSASGVAAEEAMAATGATGTRAFTAGGTPANMTAASLLLSP